jgi:DNA repair exonuclease SbcCD ATPase subunit
MREEESEPNLKRIILSYNTALDKYHEQLLNDDVEIKEKEYARMGKMIENYQKKIEELKKKEVKEKSQEKANRNRIELEYIDNEIQNIEKERNVLEQYVKAVKEELKKKEDEKKKLKRTKNTVDKEKKNKLNARNLPSTTKSEKDRYQRLINELNRELKMIEEIEGEIEDLKKSVNEKTKKLEEKTSEFIQKNKEKQNQIRLFRLNLSEIIRERDILTEKIKTVESIRTEFKKYIDLYKIDIPKKYEETKNKYDQVFETLYSYLKYLIEKKGDNPFYDKLKSDVLYSLPTDLNEQYLTTIEKYIINKRRNTFYDEMRVFFQNMHTKNQNMDENKSAKILFSYFEKEVQVYLDLLKKYTYILKREIEKGTTITLYTLGIKDLNNRMSKDIHKIEDQSTKKNLLVEHSNKKIYIHAYTTYMYEYILILKMAVYYLLATIQINNLSIA